MLGKENYIKIMSGCLRANVAHFIFCHFWPGPQERRNGLSFGLPLPSSVLIIQCSHKCGCSRQFLWIKEASVGNFGDLKMLYNFFSMEIFLQLIPGGFVAHCVFLS